jgi:hypothetical protein
MSPMCGCGSWLDPCATTSPSPYPLAPESVRPDPKPYSGRPYRFVRLSAESVPYCRGVVRSSRPLRLVLRGARGASQVAHFAEATYDAAAYCQVPQRGHSTIGTLGGLLGQFAD